MVEYVQHDRLSPEHDALIAQWFGEHARAHGAADPKREGVVVAHDDAGAPCGFAVWSAQDGRMNLRVVIVREDQRGRDIGSWLVWAAEARARLLGCLAMFLSTMTYQAQPFYERLGFVEVGRLEPLGRFPGRVWMEKRLV